jgi:hypothetical protein
MTLVVPTVGKQLILQHALGKTAVEDLTLKLFKNNVTPAVTDTAGTYTVADFTGYSNASLTGSSWTVTNANPAVGSYAQQSFTSSANQSSQTIYGYYVVGASSGTIYWSEAFASSQAIQNNGDVIKITPQFTGT